MTETCVRHRIVGPGGGRTRRKIRNFDPIGVFRSAPARVVVDDEERTDSPHVCTFNDQAEKLPVRRN